MMENPLPESTVRDIVSEAVQIEKEFVTDSLPVGLVGMNALLMQEYIDFVADRLMVALNCDKIYNTKNPFDWMELISLQGKTNFFEKRVGEYQKSGVMASLTEGGNTNARMFNMELDF